MYEMFTFGRFEVEQEHEEAFVEAWAEFATWASQRPGSVTIRLTRDIRKAGRFISVGQWENADAVRDFKSSPEFKQRLGGLVKQSSEFEPTDLVALRKITNGKVETFDPPADLQPIHAPPD